MSASETAKANNTVQRRIILNALCRVKSHPNAEELFTMVREQLPRISRGTVYRNLDKMVQLGEVLCLEMAGRQRRYDGNIEPHFHLRCTECGAVEDLMLPKGQALMNYLNRLTRENRIDGVNLEFTGMCTHCRAKEKPLSSIPPKQA